MKAELYDATGARYKCNAVRLNLLDNEINFLGDDGKEMTCASPIKRMALTDTVIGVKYYFVRDRI